MLGKGLSPTGGQRDGPRAEAVGSACHGYAAGGTTRGKSRPASSAGNGPGRPHRDARRHDGRPRTTPIAPRGDEAYSARAHRALLRSRGIVAVIQEPADQAGHRLPVSEAGRSRLHDRPVRPNVMPIGPFTGSSNGWIRARIASVRTAPRGIHRGSAPDHAQPVRHALVDGCLVNGYQGASSRCQDEREQCYEEQGCDEQCWEGQ